MNIDGSALLFAPRNLQVADGQATKPQDSSFTVSTGSRDDAVEAFSQEMYARISQSAYDNQGEEKDPNTVVNALTDSLDWLNERFGQAVSTAAAGMILASTQGEASEESVSGGMLRVLQMIDNNFGFAAGDQAMARFNGTLNNALNEFYDNGVSERFLAVYQDGSVTDGLSLVGDNLVMNRDFARQAMDQASGDPDAPDPTEALMEALLQDMEEYGAEETGLEETGLETSGLEDYGLDEPLSASAYDQTGVPETLDETVALKYRQAQAAYGWMPPVQADVLDMAV